MACLQTGTPPRESEPKQRAASCPSERLQMLQRLSGAMKMRMWEMYNFSDAWRPLRCRNWPQVLFASGKYSINHWSIQRKINFQHRSAATNLLKTSFLLSILISILSAWICLFYLSHFFIQFSLYIPECNLFPFFRSTPALFLLHGSMLQP